jgi:AcrR family transcriptional regulator
MSAIPVLARPSARDRLLEAADELFYAEGIRSVGIDRIIERADVAKATLYSTFGSKDELVRAYLGGRQVAWRERMVAGLARFDNPRDRLLGVFDVLGEATEKPGYRGCAFVNASAEAQPGGVVEQASDAARAGRREFFRGLAVDAEVLDPDYAAGVMVLLFDGAAVGSRMDRDPGAAKAARAIAEGLLST